MLIREKLENGDFSNSERVIVDYILDNKMKIKDMTTKEIANATYTSPSTLIRIAHKMKYKGWNDLKKEEYLESHFSHINANIPFENNDTIMSIAYKLATLKKESIDNTLSKNADVVLRICTRERLYSKIATFSTDVSIEYILDLLYSCVFALNYNKNLERKIAISKMIEKGRFSTIEYVKEEDF